MTTAPDTPEQARASALAAVARFREANPVEAEWAAQGPVSPVATEHARAVVRYAWRRPPAVAVVSPIVPRDPEAPRRYVPVSLAVSPFVAWDDPAAGLALAEILVGIMAAVEGASGEVNAMGRRPPGVVAFDVDRYLAER